MAVRADVTLERLASKHAEAMLQWMQDPEVRLNLGLRNEPSRERTDAFIERAATDPTVRAFAVLLAGRHVGNVVLDQLDGVIGTARLSIYLGESRGEGVGRSAAYLAARQAFGPLGLHKLWLIVHEGNARARSSYESLGFRHEGTLRDEFLLGSRRVDAVRMGLLAGELVE